MSSRIWVATVVLGLFTPLSVQGNKTVSADLSVAHVVRHGGETRETSIFVMHDQKFYLEGVDQKQPSSLPNCKLSMGVLSERGFRRIALLMDSAEFRSLHNSSTTIGHQDGDFWYISIPRKAGTQFLAFSAKDKNTPDVVKQLIAWFHETEKLRPIESVSLKDYRCSFVSDKTVDMWRR